MNSRQAKRLVIGPAADIIRSAGAAGWPDDPRLDALMEQAGLDPTDQDERERAWEKFNLQLGIVADEVERRVTRPTEASA